MQIDSGKIDLLSTSTSEVILTPHISLIAPSTGCDTVAKGAIR